MTSEELDEGEKLLAAAIADSGPGDCNTDAWADWCHENGDRLIAEIRRLRAGDPTFEGLDATHSPGQWCRVVKREIALREANEA